MAAGLARKGWLAFAAGAVGTCGVAASCLLVEPLPDLAVPVNKCARCAEAQCSSQTSACAAFAPCEALERGCLFRCEGDPACRSQCTLDHSQPPLDHNSLAGALDACLATRCPMECGLTCGGLSHIADPGGAPACAGCLAAHYCASEEECAADVNCQTYLNCRQGCVTGDCPGACIGPGTGFFGFYTPIAAECRTECEVGSNWACVGRIHWDPVPYPVRHLTFRVADFFTGTPKSGVTAAMCLPDDPSCAVPISGPMETDAQGAATLADSTLNAQHLGLNGLLRLTGADIQPTLFYWGFPLTMSAGSFTEPILVLSPGESGLLWSGVGAPDPALGSIAAVVLDCFGHQAPDVTFSISKSNIGKARLYYLSGSSLVTGVDAKTDLSGLAMFRDVPPGPVDVVATPAHLGRPSSRVHVNVLPGSLTGVVLGPTP